MFESVMQMLAASSTLSPGINLRNTFCSGSSSLVICCNSFEIKSLWFEVL